MNQIPLPLFVRSLCAGEVRICKEESFQRQATTS
jgi:hypothetical protein